MNKQITDNRLTKNYYITPEGRVYSDSKELKPFITRGGHLAVSLETNKGFRQFLIVTLLLKYFVGGYVPRRPFVYTDGNPLNCQLSNIQWKYGFNGSMDYKWLTSVDIKELKQPDRYVVYYYMTRDINYIFRIVEENKGIIYKECLSKFGLLYWGDIKLHLVSEIKKILDGYRFKPSKKDKILNLFSSLIRTYMVHKIREKSKLLQYYNNHDYHTNDVKQASNQTITEEINEIFSNFS